MVLALAASLVGSFAMAWLCGAAYISEPGSSLRGRGMLASIVIGALSFVPLPPQILILGASPPMKIPGDDTGIAGMMAFPHGFVAWPWWALWVLGTVGATLVGLQVWRAGKPGWRSGTPGAYDTSPSGRARAILLVADSLADVADTIARLGITAKDAEKLAPDLRIVGRRLASSIPSDAAALYRQIASRGVPATVAGPTARFLGEGVRDAVQVPADVAAAVNS